MPPQASQTLFGWKAMASTVHPSADSGMISFGSPSAGFHSQDVPSVRQQEASVLESGENVRNVIGARGPSAGGRNCPAWLSQMCSRESGLALVTAMYRPSGLHATASGFGIRPAGGRDWPVTVSQTWRAVSHPLLTSRADAPAGDRSRACPACDPWPATSSALRG